MGKHVAMTAARPAVDQRHDLDAPVLALGILAVLSLDREIRVLGFGLGADGSKTIGPRFTGSARF